MTGFAHKVALVLALVLTCASCQEHSRQRRSDSTSVFDRVVHVSFDRPDSNPEFNQEGDIEYSDGITGMQAGFLDNSNSSMADCLIMEDTPLECPYDVGSCEQGMSIAVWVNTGLGQDGCGGSVFSVGGSIFAFSPRPFTTLEKDPRLFLNFAINDVTIFCGLDFNETALWLDVWTHMVFTLESGGDSVRPLFYVNGTNFNMSRNGPNVCYDRPFNHTEYRSLLVGCRKKTGNTTAVVGQCGFNGLLDEFCLYDRVLTEDEIQYLSTIGNTCSDLESGSTATVQQTTTSHYYADKGSTFHHVTTWLVLVLLAVSTFI